CIEDLEPNVPPKSLLVLAALYSLTEIYEFATKLALKNVLDDAAVISVELHGMKNRKLTMMDPFRRLFSDYVCKEDVLPRSITVSSGELYKSSHELALDHMTWLLELFGWTASHIRSMLKDDQDKFLKGLI